MHCWLFLRRHVSSTQARLHIIPRLVFLSLSLLYSLPARSLANEQPLIAYLRNEALEFNIVGSAEGRKASHIGERARQRANEAEGELADARQREEEEATFTPNELLDMLATLEREFISLQRSKSGGGGADLALAVARENVMDLERRLAAQEQRTKEAEEKAKNAEGSKVCAVQ